jgi:hypothetical protein
LPVSPRDDDDGRAWIVQHLVEREQRGDFALAALPGDQEQDVVDCGREGFPLPGVERDAQFVGELKRAALGRGGPRLFLHPLPDHPVLAVDPGQATVEGGDGGDHLGPDLPGDFAGLPLQLVDPAFELFADREVLDLRGEIGHRVRDLGIELAGLDVEERELEHVVHVAEGIEALGEQLPGAGFAGSVVTAFGRGRLPAFGSVGVVPVAPALTGDRHRAAWRSVAVEARTLIGHDRTKSLLVRQTKNGAGRGHPAKPGAEAHPLIQFAVIVSRRLEHHDPDIR